MKFLELTHAEDNRFLIRMDLIQQVRPHKDGSAVWFPTGVVQETVEQIRRMLEKENGPESRVRQ